MGIKKRKSFTIMELIVAVGVIGFIIPTVFNIFFIMIRQELVLVAYQEMKQEGDSAQGNIKNILQNRAAFITDSVYTALDVCPLPLTPTPTLSPNLYINDRDGKAIHLYETVPPVVLASDSGKITPQTYNLTSVNVTISDLGFSCYKINEFTPPIVSTTFTVHKSTAFKEILLPYTFKVKLRNY